MKSNTKKVISMSGFVHAFPRGIAFISAVVIAIGAISAPAKDGDNGRGNDDGRRGNRAHDDDYQVVNLASDQSGVAMLQDTNLVNAWGISFSSTSPFWVSANGTGKALLYAVTNDDQGAV